MAYHSIVLSKIEWANGGDGEQEWWENKVGAVELGVDAGGGGSGFIDCTFDGLDTYPDEAYVSNAASTVYVPGTGWVYNTAGTTDTIASHALSLASVYEELYGATVFAAINWDPFGTQAPTAIRLTIDVTTALSGASDDLEFYITHPDLFGEFYLVRRSGGSTTSVPALCPITATGTAADIKQYVYTFDIVPTGSAQYDIEGIDAY